MPTHEARATAGNLDSARMRLGRQRAQLAAALQDLQAAIPPDETPVGELTSVELLRCKLDASGTEPRPRAGETLTFAAVTQGLLWLQELQDGVLEPGIAEDCECEVEETHSAAAARIVAQLKQVENKAAAYRTALADLADQLPQEEFVMNDADRVKFDRPIQVRVSPAGPSTTAGGSKVQAQLVATLDSFGLPHRDGILDPRRPDASRTADRLIEMLDRRFEVSDDPISGLRAAPRRYALTERSARPDGELVGRMALGAELGSALAMRVGMTLDDLLALADSLEDWPINDPVRVDSARSRVGRQLDALRELASRPGGPPASRATYEGDMLKDALAQQLFSLGLRTKHSVENAKWPDLAKAFEDGARERFKKLPGSVVEEITGLIAQLFGEAFSLVSQLSDQSSTAQRSEQAYHLRRIMEAIATQVEATRADMDGSRATATWVGATVQGANGRNRYLADELHDTLDWLEDLAGTYGLSDRAYDEMRPATMDELESACRSLNVTLGTCRTSLESLNVADDDDVIERIVGLRSLIESVEKLAGGLKH